MNILYQFTFTCLIFMHAHKFGLENILIAFEIFIAWDIHLGICESNIDSNNRHLFTLLSFTMFSSKVKLECES
jgi:hypothetical protein